MCRSGDIVIRVGWLPTGILLVIWSVAESITVTELDVDAVTNKFCPKAEEREMQTTAGKTARLSNPSERSGRKGERARGFLKEADRVADCFFMDVFLSPGGLFNNRRSERGVEAPRTSVRASSRSIC